MFFSEARKLAPENKLYYKSSSFRFTNNKNNVTLFSFVYIFRNL